jgi:hypothetical protein
VFKYVVGFPQVSPVLLQEAASQRPLAGSNNGRWLDRTTAAGWIEQSICS